MTDDTPKKLKAEDNPWFLLATLYGQPSPGKAELKSRNRMAWNRYMANALSPERRAELVNSARCSKEEMAPFEAREIEVAFSKRCKHATTAATTSIPDFEADSIDLSNIEFDGLFDVEGFFFSKPVTFSGTIFSDDAIFERATFYGSADFKATTFSGSAKFESVRFFEIAHFATGIFSDKANFAGASFSDGAVFSGSKFHNVANFKNAIFSGGALVQNATFSGPVGFNDAIFSSFADFQNATFSAPAMFERTKFRNADFGGALFSSTLAVADFESANFSGSSNFTGATFTTAALFTNVIFSNGAIFNRAIFRSNSVFVNANMEGPTSFEGATFGGSPPRFFGAQLHEGTIWRDADWPVPARASEAGAYVDAYERLKLEMDRLKKHEDELDFFALELQSRRVLAGNIAGIPITLYGLLCDYGRSYFRPLIGLFVTIAIGAILFLPHFTLSKYPRAIGLSLANTFAVLGFRKDFITIEALSRILKVVSAVQTVAGIVLLFCMGLAIRNRFRMK
jgi:uncharacterized protein YjbI with pentapeptide repeats